MTRFGYRTNFAQEVSRNTWLTNHISVQISNGKISPINRQRQKLLYTYVFTNRPIHEVRLKVCHRV